MLDWLIIGGGPHGVHLAIRLLHAGVTSHRLRIIDPARRLLSQWLARTAGLGMRYLRSPVVHHLGIGTDDLWDFARQAAAERSHNFFPPYNQPRLDLFNGHAAHLIQTFDLTRRHLQTRAHRLQRNHDHWQVSTEQGTQQARAVALCLGGSIRPRLPSWGASFVAQGRGHHIFGDASTPSPGDHVVVLGGGITAGQYTLKLLDEGRRVTLVTRAPIRVRPFDVDAGWMGPRCMGAFEEETSLVERRHAIDQARFRGSMPHEVYKQIRSREGNGLQHVVATSLTAETAPTLRLRTPKARIDADHIVFCTGFHRQRPGGTLIDGLVTDGLPISPCGYPVLDDTLQWSEGLFVSGPLAELQLGPAAPNLLGARWAARRILDAYGSMARSSTSNTSIPAGRPGRPW